MEELRRKPSRLPSDGEDDLKVFKVSVAVDSNILICDAIRYKGKTWLVPFWLEDYARRVKRPARIILVDDAKLEEAPSGYPFDFVLPEPLPRELLNHLAPIPKDTRYEVVDQPKIEVESHVQN